ncbi:MAG: AMP-binding protein, partial [Gammaproteobacteria bacterium]|nr:AMP-binding protein [Gammaproteobacteria bacterium]
MKLLHELILFTANRDPASPALRHRLKDITYAELAAQVSSVSGGLLECGVQRGDRVAIYLPKQPEAVIAYFATSMAGAVFVPINSQLKAAQVEHILDDCAAKILITTADRAQSLRAMCAKHNGLQTVVLDGDEDSSSLAGSLRWEELLAASANQRRSDESDLAALFYTSGSTGKPKGVMLSHCNLVTGAESVSQYLQNDAGDRLLTVLPFSFDYGFSQLSTAFLVGACVVLFEYLLPRDVVRAVKNERITGLACVPTVWLQLSRQQWPVDITNHLRYITNSGGSLPQTALGALRKKLPKTDVYLMYGLTEAFRSTYLDPTEIDRRPTSIGKAVPNAKVMIVHADGSPCGANEPGELVHSGPF